MTRLPSATRSVQSQEREPGVDQGNPATNPIEPVKFSRSHSALQRSMEARDRLTKKKKETAQAVRDESTRLKDERLARMAEEKVLVKTIQSLVRIEAREGLVKANRERAQAVRDESTRLKEERRVRSAEEQRLKVIQSQVRMDARERLAKAKKERAQAVRDESNRLKEERRIRIAEDEELKSKQSQIRMEAWEALRHHREAQAAKVKGTRDTSAVSRKEEPSSNARSSKEKADLERMKSLRERIREMEAQPILGVDALSADDDDPGETIEETLRKITQQLQQEEDDLKRKRQAANERHIPKQKRHHSLPGPSAPSHPGPSKRKKVASTDQVPTRVHDTRGPELARLKRELHLLEIQNPTKKRSKK